MMIKQNLPKIGIKYFVWIVLALSITLFLWGCGGGGSSGGSSGAGSDDPPAAAVWVRNEVVQVDSSGLLSPRVKAAALDDGTFHAMYFDTNDTLADTYDINHLILQIGDTVTRDNITPEPVISVDNCNSLSFALSPNNLPITGYQGGEVKECGGPEQADAMISTRENDAWQEYTGAIGEVERNPVFNDGLAGGDISIAVDSNGDIHLCYQFFYEGCDAMNFTYPDLNYVKIDGNAPHILVPEESVEGNIYNGNVAEDQNNSGKHCAVILNNEENPVIFYYAELSEGTRGLRVAEKRNGIWEKAWVDTGFGIGGISAGKDFEGNLGVAYYAIDYIDEYTQEESPACLRYAHESQSEPGSWHSRMIDDSSLCGKDPSLAYDSSGNPAIAYHESESYGGYLLENLKIAVYDGDRWELATVSSEGNIGHYNTLLFDEEDTPYIFSYSHSHTTVYMFHLE